MMTEIYNHGPISCEVAVTDNLVAFIGDIFVDLTNLTELNHDISMVEFGEEDGSIIAR